MINDYLKTGLPFYDNVLKQDRYKEGCDSDLGCLFELPSPKNALLPFQIERAKTAGDIPFMWTINTLDGSVAMNISSNLNKLEIVPNGDRENIMYNGQALQFQYNNGQLADLEICNGFYYSVLTFKNNVYYSEVFCVNNAIPLENYLKIEWNSTCKIGRMVYSTGYKNVLYLDAELSKPTPSTVEEGEEIDGRFIPISVRYINEYRIEVYVPEFIVEALFTLSLYPDVVITLKNNLYSAIVSKINVTNIEWDEMSCKAIVELKFQQDEEMNFKACC